MSEKGTILVVEDSIIQATLLKRTLTKHGYDVITAPNGRRGLELALSDMPDVVVSDVVMPQMNGYELCRQIKGNEAIKRIPVILLTELRSIADIIEGLQSLSDDYITKPYDEQYLISKIDFYINIMIPCDDMGEGFDVTYKDTTYTIYSNYKKVFNLLFAIYENTLRQYQEMMESKEALKKLNDELIDQAHTIKESENMFKFFVQTIPDVIYKVDVDGRFTFINDSIRDYGHEPEELIGKHFSIIFNPDDAQRISRETVLPRFIGKNTGQAESPKLFDERRSVERKTYNLEVRVKTATPDKSVIADVSSYGIYKFDIDKRSSEPEGTLGVIRCKDDECLGSAGIIRNITEKKRVETALFESEKVAQVLMENASDAILRSDTEGNLIDANRKAVQLLGYSKQELLQMKVKDIHPQPELDLISADIQRSVETDTPQCTETLVLRKDGSTVAVEISGCFIEVNGKKIMQGIFRDLTERRLAQEKLRRQEQLLIQQSKMAAMGEMIGVIAHQWKQPLNILSLVVHELNDAREYGELDAACIDKVVNNSMKQVEFMSKTIDEFKNFFKPSKEKETFFVTNVIAEVFSLLSAQLQHSSIAYQFTCNCHKHTFRHHSEIMECDGPPITTYKNQLAHVLLNLISNSNEAIIERRQNGLSDTNGMIAINCYQGDNLLKLEITDNGGGIPEEILDKVCEPYFTTKKDKGTGIGLYMAKVIVEERLGGRMYVQNVEDGAMFTLEFNV
ncbi:MAG: PAS domain S-box protein [Candidatus Magnetominusculus sp. LBB02]|nr:PAS domain S-box protein [Candidatus Magnetominusculus sp. LBB02]